MKLVPQQQLADISGATFGYHGWSHHHGYHCGKPCRPTVPPPPPVIIERH